MNKNKYSDLKFLGYPETLVALKEKKVIAPVHLRIKPTNVCNHDCWYCAYHASGLQLGDQMTYRDVIPFEKLNEVADDIVKMGVSAVTFSGGGEPLLYKRLPEIIKKLYKGGVKVATLTNGSNLKGLMAEAFQKYGTWVRVSLDGYDDDSYAKARGIKVGEFTKLMENMRAFVTPTEVLPLLKLVWDNGTIVPGEGSEAMGLINSDSGIVTDNQLGLVSARDRCAYQLKTMRKDHVRSLHATPYKISITGHLFEYMHKLWLEEAPVSDLS